MEKDSAPTEMEVAPGLWISDLLCAWLPEGRACVVADLHLGFEAVAASDGANFPERQKAVLLKRLAAIIARYRPGLVVVAGDFKHNFGRGARLETDEVREVLGFLDSRVEPAFVRGNHDNYLAGLLPPGAPLPDSMRVGRFRVAHGHRDIGPPPASTTQTILAHEHPSLRLRDPVGGRAAAPAFLFDPGSGTLVIPALSPLAPGSDILRGRPLSPVLRASGVDRFRIIAATGPGLLDFGTAGALREWEG
jgi:putative SbcD/Mre11-related phosphoesterase